MKMKWKESRVQLDIHTGANNAPTALAGDPDCVNNLFKRTYFIQFSQI